MKPESIRRFDLFYLGSVALSLVGSLLSYSAMVAQMEARTAAAGVQLGSGMVIGTVVLSIAISLLLWFLVSRKAVAIAKWIIVLFFVLGLISTIGVAGSPGLFSGDWTLLKTISAVVLLLEAGAVYYLFQPDAKAWFAGAPGEDAIDPAQDS
jgi:hypothetical protein